MVALFRRLSLIATVLCLPWGAWADELPLIDAHSQLPAPSVSASVIELMDRAGIRHIILSYRAKGAMQDVLDLAAAHPGRITPAVKIKGRHWPTGHAKFYKHVKKRLGGAGAMGEALLYHAAKGDKAPEWTVRPDDKQFQFVLETSRTKGWPLIVHIEFRATPEPDAWMTRLEALLTANRDVAFPLIHMGQLDPAQAARLIPAHPNVFFMLSHANPVITAHSSQPWTNMFDGDSLNDDWKSLMTEHADRFILNFDNVWEEHWQGDLYIQQARLWRKALGGLPSRAAHAIAHGNAERLWHLPAAQ